MIGFEQWKVEKNSNECKVILWLISRNPLENERESLWILILYTHYS
jgi:hypothetical protein